MTPNAAQIRLALYAMKREFGVPANIIRRTSSVTDRASGEKTVVRDAVNLQRAMILPAVIDREFVYNLTFIASNKNFTYGALFDAQQRTILIDRKDIPTDFEIKPGQYVVTANARYEIQSVESFPENLCYNLTAKATTGEPLENLIIKQAVSYLHMCDQVEVSL